MSNELTVNASLAYEDSTGAAVSITIANLLRNVTTKVFNSFKLSVATSETAVPLGGVSAPRYLIIINRDDTNYVEVKCAASGTIFAKLLAGDVALVPLGSGAQAPVMIANTAACLVEGLVVSL